MSLDTRPRVLHIIHTERPGSVGGADLHVLDLCAGQNETGLCHAEVLAIHASPEFRRRAAAAQVVLHNPVPRPPGKWWKIAAALRDHDAHIVHAHGYEADYFAALATATVPGWRGVPVVMTCHGLIRPNLRHRVMSALDLRAMRRARALIAVADSSAAGLRRVLPNTRVHTIRNGVRPPERTPSNAEVRKARAALGARHDELLVGFVGRLSREKRPDLFLRMADLLSGRGLRFAFIGGGALTEEISAAARNGPAAAQISFGGVWGDIDLLYGALDVLVLPSDTEGTSRVVQEAQLRGVPVIASAVGGVPALIQHKVSGILVCPNQYTDTAEVVTRLANEPELRMSLATAARSRASTWTHHDMARSVHEVYEQALSVSSRSPRGG